MEEPSTKKLKLCNSTDDQDVVSSSSSSSTSIVSNSNGVFQSPITNPILSPESWELIFKDVHLKDFLAVINTCPEWSHLLGSRKTTALLPLVLPLLIESDHLPDKAIQNCRRMNRESRTAIDEAIQREVSCPNKSYKNEMKRRWRGARTTGIESLLGVKFDFEDEADVQRLMKHAETKPNPSSNPFLSKHISIGIGYVLPEDIDSWKLSFHSLLSSYGHFIQRLTSYMCTWTLGETVTTLLELLHQMPNLKILKMIGCIYMREEVHRIRCVTFPELKNMESLDLEDFMSRDLDSEVPIVNPFLERYGNQLKTFRCRGELLGRRGMDAEVLNRLLPNVKQLCVSQVTLAAMTKLRQLSWPVEHLQLFECSIANGGGVMLVQNTNSVINQFANTLVELDLYVKMEQSNGQQLGLEHFPATEVEQLPKLKILRCGELRELQLCTDAVALKMEIEAAKYAFELLPKLDRIVIWHEFKNHRKQKPIIITRNLTKRQNKM